ncbi:MAG: hypothetical protein HOE48_10830 [Candidatus Latescibacteria bacterium]|nr:hypothetical protein [Candidatus Latescibacterota bacterium]MBT4138403.1 hypothetical protein [Candidatus Latescibacterota bacterium]
MGFRIFISCMILSCIYIPTPTQAQTGEIWHGGLRVGQLFSHTELQDHYGINAYAFVRGGIKRYIMLEMGAGYGQYEGIGFNSDVWLSEFKLVFQPWRGRYIRPLVYVGTGLIWHNIQLFPIQATADAKKTGWKPIIPGGFGFQIPMTKSIRIEFLGGYTYTYRDDLDGTILTKGNDGFYHWTIGITFGSYIKPRPSKAKPKRVPVPESPDDDKDGLTDRDELNIYHTNPDQSDTDKDGLTDYEEVRLYFTNPNVLDSDADGLIDSEEILSYKTDPHIADTDSDGLTDGQEVITHLTDPLKADTDGDGMSDGDEIIKGRDPLEKE